MLQARGLGKSFGAVRVLAGIDLDVISGEVHAVIGENGAGKSTLMKLLAGYEQPSTGTIVQDGAPVRFASPGDAERAGIVLVHQELLLSGALTVAENLFLGREQRRGPFLNRGRMRRETEAALARLGCRADPDAPVAGLSLADRQMVQIARALLTPHRVVIFDEPTAVLTPLEAATLFRAIAELRDRGVAILYISHRLGDVEALAERITVLRDGGHVATHPAGALTQLDMARLMVGRDMSDLFPPRPPALAAESRPVFEVRHAHVPGHVEDASFALRMGEILGFAGMVGAGRTELFEGLLHLRPARIGGVLLDGARLRLRHVADATRAGIAYLTEDRKAKGLLLAHGLPANLSLMALRRVCRGPFLDAAREDAALDHAIDTFDLRVRDRAALAGQLSGGNQQKLLLARIMQTQPRVLIIDEPTRGIDIGTKGQIYRFIADLAATGIACIVISSEMQELLGLCHRILVMRHGRIVADLRGEDMTEERIVVHATGVTLAHAARIAEQAA